MTDPKAGPGGSRRPGKRVAIMQPYFYPYAGYFRLFAAVDEFVVYDCVQFPRRGRVHRCEVPGPDGGSAEWLTLPLAKQPRDTRIRDLAFAAGARAEFDRRLARLPWLRGHGGGHAEAVLAHLHAPLEDVVGYLQAGLEVVTGALGIGRPIVRSSMLSIDPTLHGQDRIIAIAVARGASSYVNPPGGRHLYDDASFERAGLGLEFLPDYRGCFAHLLPALMGETLEPLREDIEATLAGPVSAP